ncbi:MAG: hypothetical protein FD166_3675 [Bacteroidetes bacterium]|nr:MAG: hypothetical protein FD166_3675 [Bacteroidota bacterium]
MEISTNSFNVIACEALARAVFFYAAQTPHRINVALQKIGLHDRPNNLREHLQNSIDQTSAADYDAILLTYGLCGRAIDGLVSRDVQLVIPRAHDCITLYLGSRESYSDQQNNHPGTYWYSQDYLERSGRYGENMVLGSVLPPDLNNTFEEFVRKYGEENAQYLMETLNGWQQRYTRAVLFETEFGVNDEIRRNAQAQAKKNGWNLESIPANFQLIKKQIFGEWDQDFLVVPPQHRIQMTADEGIIEAVPLNDLKL